MTQRAVLYARVSSDDTRNEGRNLAGQLEMCREYALQRGWTVVAELAEDDRGASGASLDLPQLNRLLDMARSGELDVVVVREIDRFSRRLAKQLIIEEELKRRGVRIEYVLGEYPDTPEGNLMKNVKASVAEYEREKIAQRMTRGRRLIVKNGSIMLHGDKPPYGYRVSEDGKNLVIHEPEAQIVRLIFTWYAIGDEEGQKFGSRKIAQILTERNIPTWEDIHGYNSKRRPSGNWSSGVIGRLLARKTYMGKWEYGRRKNNKMNPESYLLTLDVPAIVTPELWKLAQSQKLVNKQRSRRNTKRQYLLTSRIKCGVCGTRMNGMGRPSRGKLYLYYYCNTKRGDYAVKKQCDNGTFRADHVDRLIWEWIRSLLIDTAALSDALDAYRFKREEDMRPLRERLEVADKLLDDNRRQLERLVDLYVRGDIPREILVDRKTRLMRTIESVENERERLAAQLDTSTWSAEQVDNLKSFAAQVAEGLDEVDDNFQGRRRVVDALDVRVELSVEDGEKIISAECILGTEQLKLVQGGQVPARTNSSGREGPGFGTATPTFQNEACASVHPPSNDGSRRPVGRTCRLAPSYAANRSPSPAPVHRSGSAACRDPCASGSAVKSSTSSAGETWARRQSRR